MTTIKRFTPDYKMHAVRFEAFAREAEHGELVRFDAHQQVVSAIEAERDAQQKRADALAVENAEMRGVIDAAVAVANNSAGIAGWHLNGEIAGWDEILPELNIETPATDAALAAIQAQGVEKFADFLGELYQCEKANTAKGKAYKHVVFLACRFVNELREAK
ncbi:TPA: hypothetical protein ACXJAD_004407 [Serratia marcescens]|uniref:hypothetical protein n=1 Tax=Serratia marcescens TaxID=615 RepID=UPI0018F4A31B|nr:hypothetical protein [Serratia marcescens]